MAKSAKGRLSSQVSNSYDLSRSAPSCDNKLTPHNFDEFVPWMCLIWQSPEAVMVTRMYQEEYIKAVVPNKKPISKSTKAVKAKIDSESLSNDDKVKPVTSIISEDNVQLRAFYNFQGNLLEVSIVGCSININSTIMRVLGMTVPYHTALTKLTIARGGLSALAIHEIAKFLPHSHLTDICLDDTNVFQLNYPELLKVSSKLKNLSLKRCQLGDKCCTEIAACIETGTPGGTLRTLDLSSNAISDKGALALADVLRRNRQLLHLNLSGNTITDKGGKAILNSLMEFPMREDEIVNMKIKRLEYNRRKISVYVDLVNGTIAAKQRADDRSRGSRSRSNKSMKPTSSKTNKSPSPKKGKKPIEVTTSATEKPRPCVVDYPYPELEQKARETVGEFFDTFDAYHVFMKDRYFYCVGNMYLCSLNLAYNNLEYITVKKIREVLEYQSELDKPPGTTGLMRISFDGNYVPGYCDEYVDIDTFLQKAVVTQLPKMHTAILKKKTAPGSRKSATAINSQSSR